MSNTSTINVTNINIAVVDAGQTKLHQNTPEQHHGNRKRQSTASTHKQQVT